MIDRVDEARISQAVFHLSKDPLPCRRLNYTLPGHDKCTLHEADDFIRDMLESWGYQVESEAVRVQAYRRDTSKPLTQQFSQPPPSDPWYHAFNLYAKKTGKELPDELIILISHKDSQSWLDIGPGANDNAVGTAGNLEIARVLSSHQTRRSVWFVFCNEEHTPWTSETAARRLAESGLNVIAVVNLDGIGVKSEADRLAGRMTNVTRYTTVEGEALADLMAELNEEYGIGLTVTKFKSERPNDDDGSFVKAGIPRSVLNIGSFPYADPNYHSEADTPELVDVRNAKLATQLTLAAVLHIDTCGPPGANDQLPKGL
jgi:hypothetical protein